MNFDYKTFCPDGLNRNRDIVGNIEGNFQNKPILCRAYQASNGDLVIGGFLGKYSASDKLWPANVWLEKNGQLKFYFGFESRAKRNGASDLLHNPDLYYEKAPPNLFTPLPDNCFRPPVEILHCNRCNQVFEGDECSSCELDFAKQYGY